MFEIEKLLNLFSDEKTKEILLQSYCLSQEENKALSDSVFEQLLLLKTIDPRINIVLDKTKEKSYFQRKDNVIYLNVLSIENFFHELTHLLSYNFSGFQVPNEYYLFKRNFFSSPEKTDLMIDLLDLCKRRKISILEDKISEAKQKNSDIVEKDIMLDPQNTQIDTISRIEGIVDSIFSGLSYTYGLTYNKDNNLIARKTKKASGHSCEYFSVAGAQFEEILADYQTIKLTNPNSDLFGLLKNIIGDEFVSFLDQRCSEMCTSLKHENVDTNNNNKGKI